MLVLLCTIALVTLLALVITGYEPEAGNDGTLNGTYTSTIDSNVYKVTISGNKYTIINGTISGSGTVKYSGGNSGIITLITNDESLSGNYSVNGSTLTFYGFNTPAWDGNWKKS